MPITQITQPSGGGHCAAPTPLANAACLCRPARDATQRHRTRTLNPHPLQPLQRRSGQKPYVLAQRYVDNPLLVDGRKFGIRVWVVVTGFNPLRAYIHANGLVLFSTHG